ELLRHGSREFLSLAMLLVAGSAIAALVQTLLPRQWLLELGGAPTLSILALMLLALVVSVCSSVDAFLALGFAAHVTPGAVLAFLLLGPVIDLKLVGLLGLLFKPRGLLLTSGGAVLVVLLIGQWVNLWRL
ncbi:MAG: permease, partial [Cyanobacteriota bacterium]|nr:permease [Cyanobacteriota bacterium]